MVFNVLVKEDEFTNPNLTSCAVLGIEVADTNQTAAALNDRPTITWGGVTYKHVMATVLPTAVADIDAMLNNYEQFNYIKATSTMRPSTNYNPTRNRKLAELDGRYPYACNNLQVNVGGMATTSGGIIRIGDGIFGEVLTT